MTRNLSVSLESVRGLAALVVLVAHAVQWFVWPLVGKASPVVAVTQHAAHFAVLVFFTLSGYVICFSMSRHAAKNGALDETAFLKARVLRIIPPFAFAFVVSLAVAGIIGLVGFPTVSGPDGSGVAAAARISASSKFKDILATGLLSNGMIPGTGPIATNGPLWSLSYEVWLYVLAMLVWISTEGRWRTSRSRIAAVAVGIFVVLQIGQPLRFLECAGYWSIGAAVFLRRHQPRFRRLIDGILAALLVIGVLELALFWKRVWPLSELNIRLFPAKSVFLVLALLLFARLHTAIPHAVQRPLGWLAASSYTLYITHFPLLMMLYVVAWRPYTTLSATGKAAFLSAACAGVILFCHVVARYFEDRARWSRLMGWETRAS